MARLRSLRSLLTLVPLILFASCLDVDAMNIYIYPDRDNFNRGRIRIEFLNIHSTESSLAKQKEEMNAFFAGYEKDAENIVEAIPVLHHKARLIHQKILSTDGEITGEFNSLVTVLSGILENCEYRIEGSPRRFSFYRKNPMNDNSNLNLIVQYAGKIESNNSSQYDARTGVMKWNLSKTGDREVSFVIEPMDK